MAAPQAASGSASASEANKRVRRITVLISGSGSNLQALLDAAGTPSLPNAEITYVLSSRTSAYGLNRAKTHEPPIETSICALKTFLNKNAHQNDGKGVTRQDYDCEVARRVLESKPDLVVLAGWMHILSDSFLDILNGDKAPPCPPQPQASSQAQAQTSEASTSTSISTSSSTDCTSTATDASTLVSNLKNITISDSSSQQPQQQGTTETKTQNKATTPNFPIPIINLHPALPGAFDGANAIGRAFDAFQAGEIKHTGVMVHRVVAEVDRGEPLVVRNVEIKKDDKIEDLEKRIHEIEHQIIVEGAKIVLEELENAESSA